MNKIGRLLDRGWVPNEVKMESDRVAATACQLKVTLLGSKPAIWRRILVRTDIRLDRLHDVLQRAMGWSNSHLHVFRDKTTGFGPTMLLDDDTGDFVDEKEVLLWDIAKKEKTRLYYEYDMGDGWMHELFVEKIGAAEPRLKGLAVCLEGERACPPEDCGGIDGYAEVLSAIRDPKHADHKDMLEWIGGECDPEAFNSGKTNKALQKLKGPR